MLLQVQNDESREQEITNDNKREMRERDEERASSCKQDLTKLGVIFNLA
jgi:hypothetical protein